MQWDSATSANYYCDIWGEVHNLIVFKWGDIKKLLL